MFPYNSDGEKENVVIGKVESFRDGDEEFFFVEKNERNAYTICVQKHFIGIKRCGNRKTNTNIVFCCCRSMKYTCLVCCCFFVAITK